MIATLLSTLVLAVAPAAADTARIVVTVDEPGALPREVGAEIRDALASRIEGIKQSASIEVHLTARSAEILVDGKRASVGVTDWTGEGSARVVILQVIDLATPPPPLAALAAPPAAAPASPAVVAATSMPATVVSAQATSITLSVAPLVLRGLSSDDGLAEGVELGATLRRDRVLVGLDLKWSYGRRNEAFGNPGLVTVDMLPVALVVGAAWGRLEATVGPFVGPATLFCPEQPSSLSLISGADATVRWRGRSGGGWSWYGAGSLDLFANRLSIEPIMTKYSTPRVAASVAVGVSFGFGT